MPEWIHDPFYRLPYDRVACGAWLHRDNPDAVSLDSGEHYFLLSERPHYHRIGKVYATAETPVPAPLPKKVDGGIL